MPKFFRVQIICDLPVFIRRGQIVWRIAVAPDGKTKAVLVATRMSDQKDFIIERGRYRDMENILKRGIDSHPGTIRHELFLVLATQGKAVMEDLDDAESSF